MSSGDDLYGLLGVKPTASARDIADGFALLDGPIAAKARDAYEVLRDPARRRSYDDTRRARSNAAEAASASDHHADAGVGDVELELSFDQAALGTTATVHVETPTSCTSCSGTGAVPGDACSACAGTGFHTRTSGGIHIRTECRACEGAGASAASPCTTCNGHGEVEAARAVMIRVPAGVEDGARLRFKVPAGEDHTSRQAVVRVAGHPYFTREGNDLRIQLPITLAEAALGATVAVPTLGGAVAIRVPPGTRGGRTLRIRGRGIPTGRGAGDLLATVDVVIPTDLSNEQREALEAYAVATPSPRQHFTQLPTTYGAQ